MTGTGGEHGSDTCSLQPSGAGCKGRASPSASSGRGAHLCDCGGRCGAQGHIPPGQLVGGTPHSLLCKESSRPVFSGLPFLKLEPQHEGADTFLSRFANDFNVLHGNFKKLLCDDGRHIHLRDRKIMMKNQLMSHRLDTSNHRYSVFFYLLGSANQNSGKETQRRPQFIHKGLVVCYIPENKKTQLFSSHIHLLCNNI